MHISFLALLIALARCQHLVLIAKDRPALRQFFENNTQHSLVYSVQSPSDLQSTKFDVAKQFIAIDPDDSLMDCVFDLLERDDSNKIELQAMQSCLHAAIVARGVFNQLLSQLRDSKPVKLVSMSLLRRNASSALAAVGLEQIDGAKHSISPHVQSIVLNWFELRSSLEKHTEFHWLVAEMERNHRP